MPASELTIVDRQRALFKWRRQQQSSYSYFASSFGDDSIQPISVAELQHQPTVHAISGHHDEEKNGRSHYHGVSHEILGDLGNGWPDLATGGYPHLGISRLGEGECAGPAVDNIMGGGRSSPPARKERGSSDSKKRNVEETRGGKLGADATEDEVTQKKKMKGGAEEAAVEPKQEIQQSSSDGSGSSNRRGSFREGSKEDSKAMQKPDYIHVRARRGQATDSHSLAERVRREKISERMKYLQDLVPGCNKITGKAGMLDEIINYVQSLQRQVEFLSMKLAAVNPRLEFNIDLFVNKEISSACSSRFPAVDMSLDAADPSYLQFNPLQHATACGGLNMATDPCETALRQTASSPVPDAFLDPSFDVHGSSFAWDTDIQSLYNVEFHQGRGFTLPFLSSHGNIIHDNT